MKHVSVAEILQLPVAERIRLVEAIWDSIAEVPEAVDLSEAQRAELDRRLAAYEQDSSLGSPWSEVRSRICRGG